MTQGKLRAPFLRDDRIVSAYTWQQSVFRLQHTALTTIIFWVLNLNALGGWNILTLSFLTQIFLKYSYDNTDGFKCLPVMLNSLSKPTNMEV